MMKALFVIAAACVALTAGSPAYAAGRPVPLGLRLLFAFVDTDGDGTVDRKEADQFALKVFSTFDVANTGTVSREEARTIARAYTQDPGDLAQLDQTFAEI